MTATARPILVLFLGVLAAAGALSCASARSAGPITLDYVVTPTAGGFDVRLEAANLPGRRPALRLLDTWGELADMPDHVSDLRATDAAGAGVAITRDDEDGEGRWRLARNPGAVTVTYHVSGYDPFISPEASFVTASRLVLIGYSLFLVPAGADPDAPVEASISIEAPEGWDLWASWPLSAGAYRPATLHDVWSGFAAAGDFKPARLDTGSVRVSVLTEGTAGAGLGLHIANRLLPVLREMSVLFGGAPRGDRLDVLALYRLAPPAGNRSIIRGTSQEGAFLCLATPDRLNDLDGLTALAAHECFHFYLGGAVAAAAEPPFQNAPDLIWLIEGVTEYMTYRLMERSGVLSKDGFAAVARRKEAEWRGTPGATAITLADAARAMDRPEIYRLVYSRGFLVAALIDERMAGISGPGAMDRALRRIFTGHDRHRGSGPLTEAQALAAFDAEAPGIGPVIERYALGSEAVPALACLAR